MKFKQTKWALIGVAFFVLMGDDSKACVSKHETLKITVSSTSYSTRGPGPVACCDNGTNTLLAEGTGTAIYDYYTLGGGVAPTITQTVSGGMCPQPAQSTAVEFERSAIQQFQDQTGTVSTNKNSQISIGDITILAKSVHVHPNLDNPDHEQTQGAITVDVAWIAIPDTTNPQGFSFSTMKCGPLTGQIVPDDTTLLEGIASQCASVLSAQLNQKDSSGNYTGTGLQLRDWLTGALQSPANFNNIQLGTTSNCYGDFTIDYTYELDVATDVVITSLFQ